MSSRNAQMGYSESCSNVEQVLIITLVPLYRALCHVKLGKIRYCQRSPPTSIEGKETINYTYVLKYEIIWKCIAQEFVPLAQYQIKCWIQQNPYNHSSLEIIVEIHHEFTYMKIHHQRWGKSFLPLYHNIHYKKRKKYIWPHL